MERFNQFDILKAIGIILVIIGHTIKGNFIGNFIYSFHMPLFFLVSGYFLKEKHPLPIKQLSKRLLKPYFVTCTLLILISCIIYLDLQGKTKWDFLLEWIISVLYGNGIENEICNIPLQSIGPLWFLLALFWGTLIVQTSLFYNKKCPALLTVVLCIIISLYLSTHNLLLPFSIRQGMLSVGYIYIGYIIKKQYPTIIIKSKIAWLPLLIIWIMSIKSGFLSILQGYANPELITLLGAICGTYFAYVFSTYLTKNKIATTILCSIGKLTLLILCIHAIEDILIPWQRIINAIPTSHCIAQIVITITRLTIVMGIVYSIKKIPLVKRIFNT